jgi:RNase P subunit RPR2
MIRWLVNYVRQCLCKHEWEQEQSRAVSKGWLGNTYDSVRVSLTCTKCGWHRRYWKY